MKTIFVNGLSGKMGKTIKNLILDNADFEIVKTISDSDLVIDFSRPESTMPLVQEAKEHKKPLIIGTTGFTEIEVKLIEEASTEIPIMLSFNMSRGIYYFKKWYLLFQNRLSIKGAIYMEAPLLASLASLSSCVAVSLVSPTLSRSRVSGI